MPRHSDKQRQQPWTEVYNPLVLKTSDAPNKPEPVSAEEAVPGGSAPEKLERFKKMNKEGKDLCPYLSENK